MIGEIIRRLERNRCSNNTHLLVYEKELDKMDAVLRKHGYIQSMLTNGELKEAARKEKLIQRMNYHDLGPYYKRFNDD